MTSEHIAIGIVVTVLVFAIVHSVGNILFPPKGKK
jgi:hypothetical protein